MSVPSPRDEMALHLPADLDAGSVTEAHAQLLIALDAMERSDTVAVLELDANSNDVSPLSRQLLVSARRTFPENRISFGQLASAALASLGQHKEI